MALNLWKLGGQPTNYNPLPQGWITNPYKFQNGDYVFRFRAKSQSKASLRYQGVGANFFSTIVNLTPEFQVFEKSFNAPFSGQVEFNNRDSAPDIIIDSIELVQKPLAKLTVNGVDGLNSGKWNIYSGHTVLDDETIKLIGGTSTYFAWTGEIAVLPNTTYTINGEVSLFDGLLQVNKQITFMDSNKATINSIYNSTLPQVITTPNNCYYLKVGFYTQNAVGYGLLKRPTLTLGTTPAPYSRKTGDRMVLPTPKKNLFDGSLESGDIDGTTGLTKVGIKVRSVNFQSVSGNKIYTLSRSTPIDYFYIMEYDLNKNFIKFTKSGFNDSSLSITTSTNTKYVKIVDNANDLTSKIQLEEGTSATTYTPYDMQLNKKPRRYVPKKNLFDGVWATGYYVSGSGNITDQPQNKRSLNFLPVQGGKTIIMSTSSLVPSNQVRIFQYDFNKNRIRDDLGMQITLDSNTCFIRFHFGNGYADFSDWCQIEYGSIATPYEPYTQVLPKTRIGLAFNGVTDYLQLPSMTMDSVEIDCLIDSVQSTTSNFLFDGRLGYANSYVYANTPYVGSNIKDFYVGGVLKTSRLFSDIPRGIRTKVKTNFTNSLNGVFYLFTASDNLGSTSIGKTKGTLYKVTCYLGGQIVAQYDFENASNIVGSTVLQNARNLIPDFEDARWSLHANTQVFGKDYTRSNVTSAYQTRNYFIFPVINGTTYLVKVNKTGGRSVIFKEQGTGGAASIVSYLESFTFTVDSSYNGFATFMFDNGNLPSSGSFDFMRPQLYALDGMEGTLNGTPTRLNKSSRRTMYAKR